METKGFFPFEIIIHALSEICGVNKQVLLNTRCEFVLFQIRTCIISLCGLDCL